MLFQLPNGYEVLQSPQNLPPIFNGDKLVAYGVLKGIAASKKIIECTATLRGNTLGAKVEHKVPFILESSTVAPSMPVIHHLAAKALITDWESGQKEKKSIIDLSIESCVISSHTAFIAIDEVSSEPVSGTMKTYDSLPHQDVYLNTMLCSRSRSRSRSRSPRRSPSPRRAASPSRKDHARSLRCSKRRSRSRSRSRCAAPGGGGMLGRGGTKMKKAHFQMRVSSPQGLSPRNSGVHSERRLATRSRYHLLLLLLLLKKVLLYYMLRGLNQLVK